MAFLTDRTLATGVTSSDLIHIVIPSDTSQNPAGSSYKATMGQVLNLINPTTLTGGTYDSVTGSITFFDDNGGSFTVTGLVTGFSDTFVTAFTYNNANTFTITENDNSTFSSSINIVTGLTVNGSLSATTYLGLPSFTGGSGNCITDFYVTNIYGCSPITFQSEVKTPSSTSTGLLSFGLGSGTLAAGDYSFSQGQAGQANGNYSHAEGQGSLAIGNYSHSEGYESQATGTGSHAEGYSTEAIGNYSHSEGYFTRSVGDYQLTIGQYNSTASTQSAFIIGNGTSTFNRSNLVLAAGNTFSIYGDLNVSGTIYSTGSTQFISTTGITTSAVTLSSGITYNGISFSGNVDVTIPNPTNLTGLKLILKDEGGYAGSYRIRVTPASGTIDGNSYVDMNINYMSLSFVARNNNWWII